MTKVAHIDAGYDKTGMTAPIITSIQYVNRPTCDQPTRRVYLDVLSYSSSI